MLQIAVALTPQFTRVNLRKTFELSRFQHSRITLESRPAYYAYPIDHRISEESPSHSQCRGFLTECPARTKIEIKSVNESVGRAIEKKLLPVFRDQKVPQNKLTVEPFPKMAVRISKLKGTIVDECPRREVETKANIMSRVNLVFLIRRMRQELLRRKRAPYRLFVTDHEVKTRGEAERQRTIIGWPDEKGRWHEVVTIIRLTAQGKLEYGYAAILKWKTNSRRNLSKALNRGQRYEFLKEDLTDERLLARARRFAGRKLQIVGVIKKMKFRIMVQDRDGRDFCVSLDECSSPDFPRVLRQLEVEYTHTVVAHRKEKPGRTVAESCVSCADYFIKLLKQMGARAERTNLRKIDFVAAHGMSTQEAMTETF